MSDPILKRAADLQPGDFIICDPQRGNSLFYAGEITSTDPHAVEGYVRIHQKGMGWFLRRADYELEVRAS